MDKNEELDTALLDLDKFRKMCHPDNYHSETVKGMAAEFYKQLTPALDLIEGMVLKEQREMEKAE